MSRHAARFGQLDVKLPWMTNKQYQQSCWHRRDHRNSSICWKPYILQCRSRCIWGWYQDLGPRQYGNRFLQYLDCRQSVPRPVERRHDMPVKTAVSVPVNWLKGMPAFSIASYETSRSIRCWGSIEAASAGVTWKKALSNLSTTWSSSI